MTQNIVTLERALLRNGSEVNITYVNSSVCFYGYVQKIWKETAEEEQSSSNKIETELILKEDPSNRQQDDMEKDILLDRFKKLVNALKIQGNYK